MIVDEFLDLLVQSQVLDGPALRRILPQAPAEAQESVDRLADWLVEFQALTDFQAKQLLLGAGHRLVQDPYEIRDTLGRGGMGTVYLAWDRRRRRYAALKMLSSEQQRHRRGHLRFQREIEINRRLEHPNLARVFEAGLWRSTPFLAMEFVPGPTLFQLVKRHGPCHPYWGCRWVAEVADALDYAHQGGVVHRDLKPSNMIVTPERSAKLLDLGLARLYDDDHNEERVLGRSRIVGSVDYMAPEQADDSARADPRSDIYALGCLLYFLLGGRPPFHEVADRTEKIASHKTVAPTAISLLRPGTPPSLVRALNRMLAKAPADRYSVAAEVRDVLNRLATIMAEREGQPELPDGWFAGLPPTPIDWSDEGPAEPQDRTAQIGDATFWGRLGTGFQRLFGRRAEE